MTTPRRTARKATTTRARSTRPTAATRSRTTRKATTTRRRRTTATRRRTTGTATTIGAGIGTLVVSALLGASWPVRVVLVLLALALGGAYLVITHRAQARREADLGPTPAEPATTAGPT